jgi:hypothetical protein
VYEKQREPLRLVRRCHENLALHVTLRKCDRTISCFIVLRPTVTHRQPHRSATHETTPRVLVEKRSPRLSMLKRARRVWTIKSENTKANESTSDRNQNSYSSIHQLRLNWELLRPPKTATKSRYTVWETAPVCASPYSCTCEKEDCNSWFEKRSLVLLAHPKGMKIQCHAS